MLMGKGILLRLPSPENMVAASGARKVGSNSNVECLVFSGREPQPLGAGRHQDPGRELQMVRSEIQVTGAAPDGCQESVAQ